MKNQVKLVEMEERVAALEKGQDKAVVPDKREHEKLQNIFNQTPTRPIPSVVKKWTKLGKFDVEEALKKHEAKLKPGKFITDGKFYEHQIEGNNQLDFSGYKEKAGRLEGKNVIKEFVQVKDKSFFGRIIFWNTIYIGFLNS